MKPCVVVNWSDMVGGKIAATDFHSFDPFFTPHGKKGASARVIDNFCHNPFFKMIKAGFITKVTPLHLKVAENFKAL